MRTARSDVHSTRRGQIVEAAVAVIAERGIQHLSLSAIETKARMSRGQLTYYFNTKEEILLAVFDRLLQLTYQRIGMPPGQDPAMPPPEPSAWPWIEHLLTRLVAESPVSPEFGALQHTFLSQIGHRPDYRRRLALLYEEWRTGMATGLAADLDRTLDPPRVSPRTLASLVQALLHGCGMQLAADPDAFDRDEMLHLCLDMLRSYLRKPATGRRKPAPAGRKRASLNGAAAGKKADPRHRSKGTNHD
jgi:AcrR family transcriptional regulator